MGIMDLFKSQPQEELTQEVTEEFKNHPSIFSLLSDTFGSPPTKLLEIEDREGKPVPQVFREMMNDPHIAAVLTSRKAGVLSRSWDIMPADDEPESVKMADFIRESLDYVDNFELSLNALLDGIAFGYSVVEIIYEWKDDKLYPQKLIPRDPYRFKFEDGVWYLKNPGGVIPIPANKFIIFKPSVSKIEPLLMKIWWPYYIKKETLKYMAQVAERFAVPSVYAKYPPGFDKGQKGQNNIQNLLKALANLQGFSRAAFPKDIEIDSLEVRLGDKSDLFAYLIQFCNNEISKAVLGQTLTTEVGQKGTYAAAKTHFQVRREIVLQDARNLMDVINSTLIVYLIDLNFGPQDKYPVFTFDLSPDIEVEQVLDAASRGIEISKRWFYEKTGWIPPTDDEDKLIVQSKNQSLLQERTPPFKIVFEE